MATTKILARKGPIKQAIQYILNSAKTDELILTAHQNCLPGLESKQMLQTKQDCNQTNGVQYYHLILSFRPGEITPELALEIAQIFVQEHLPGYEAVIATHIDRQHIHSHIVINSVNAITGKKYHSNAQTYYQQIRAVSDRLCREHGLSVILQGETSKAMSYYEWLRQSKGQPTFRSMLEADLNEAIEDANDLGHFFLLMEHKGYEIHHGNRLGFRLRGQERFQHPGRRNPKCTEKGIEAAIEGNLEEIMAGHRPEVIVRPTYQPYKRHPTYTGFLALYYHYCYLLGAIKKRQYPPRMTPHLKAEVMKFEQYKEQFAFLMEHNISTQSQLQDFMDQTDSQISVLSKQRTILNVRRKKRQALYAALADVEALAPVVKLSENGLPGFKEQVEQYRKAVVLLDGCGIFQETMIGEKAGLYQELAKLNQPIREERKALALCRKIQAQVPHMEQDLDSVQNREQEREHRTKNGPEC